MIAKKTIKHIGSNFDTFLTKEGTKNSAESAAIKRVLAFQIAQEMKRKRITKTRMAQLMGTSRAVVDRILNPSNISITLQTMEKVADILGKRLHISLN